MLFFCKTEEELKDCTELILDFPGGGFVAMGPEHHEERLRRWTKRTGKPVLAIDYGKAPECECRCGGTAPCLDQAKL
jgi:acetyl esterase/lipase